MDQTIGRSGPLTATDSSIAASPGLRPLTSTAMEDLVGGLWKPDLWGRLGWLDVKRRYRRTIIGPFWTTITLSVYVVFVGALGAGLSHRTLSEYLPFLVSGIIVWTLLSTIVTEGCTVLSGGLYLFRNVRFEYSILLYALLWRNALIFFHNFWIYLLVMLILKRDAFGFNMLLAIPGLCLILANGAWVTLICGLLSLRFRDVSPLVATLLQISMLITPLFWPADALSGGYRWIFVELNPLYHLLDIARAPLLGGVPSLASYLVVLIMTACGCAFAYSLYSRFRCRIPYWS